MQHAAVGPDIDRKNMLALLHQDTHEFLVFLVLFVSNNEHQLQRLNDLEVLIDPVQVILPVFCVSVVDFEGLPVVPFEDYLPQQGGSRRKRQFVLGGQVAAEIGKS